MAATPKPGDGAGAEERHVQRRQEVRLGRDGDEPDRQDQEGPAEEPVGPHLQVAEEPSEAGDPDRRRDRPHIEELEGDEQERVRVLNALVV